MALSRERVGEELTKSILDAKSVKDYFRLLTESGLIYEIIPEFKGMETVVHDSRGTHYGETVYQHTLDVLNRLYLRDAFRSDDALVLTLAAMFHDVGKMVTVSEEQEKIKFLEHETASAEIAKRRLIALRFPSNIVDAVVRLIALHMKVNNMTIGGHQLPRRAFSRLYVYDLPLDPFALGGLFQLLDLCSADQNNRLTLPDRWTPNLPMLTGKDIMTYNVREVDEDGESMVEYPTPPKVRGKVLKHLHFLQLSQGLDEERLRKEITGAVKTFMTQEATQR